MKSPAENFSTNELQHLIEVANDEEGRFPEAMRAFAATLLEVMFKEQPGLLPTYEQADRKEERGRRFPTQTDLSTLERIRSH
jgi:hypothetical protein